MKPEAQRIAIAEACGWRVAKLAGYRIGDEHWFVPPDRIEEYRPEVFVDMPDLENVSLNILGGAKKPLPDYINDLNAAADFAKHLATLGWGCVANMGTDGTWECFFTKDRYSVSTLPGDGDHYGAGDTLALAICEAGLRALGIWENTLEQTQPGKVN